MDRKQITELYLAVDALVRDIETALEVMGLSGPGEVAVIAPKDADQITQLAIQLNKISTRCAPFLQQLQGDAADLNNEERAYLEDMQSSLDKANDLLSNPVNIARRISEQYQDDRSQDKVVRAADSVNEQDGQKSAPIPLNKAERKARMQARAYWQQAMAAVTQSNKPELAGNQASASLRNDLFYLSTDVKKRFSVVDTIVLDHAKLRVQERYQAIKRLHKQQIAWIDILAKAYQQAQDNVLPVFEEIDQNRERRDEISKQVATAVIGAALIPLGMGVLAEPAMAVLGAAANGLRSVAESEFVKNLAQKGVDAIPDNVMEILQEGFADLKAHAIALKDHAQDYYGENEEDLHEQFAEHYEQALDFAGHAAIVAAGRKSRSHREHEASHSANEVIETGVGHYLILLKMFAEDKLHRIESGVGQMFVDNDVTNAQFWQDRSPGQAIAALRMTSLARINAATAQDEMDYLAKNQYSAYLVRLQSDMITQMDKVVDAVFDPILAQYESNVDFSNFSALLSDITFDDQLSGVDAVRSEKRKKLIDVIAKQFELQILTRYAATYTHFFGGDHNPSEKFKQQIASGQYDPRADAQFAQILGAESRVLMKAILQRRDGDDFDPDDSLLQKNRTDRAKKLFHIGNVNGDRKHKARQDAVFQLIEDYVHTPAMDSLSKALYTMMDEQGLARAIPDEDKQASAHAWLSDAEQRALTERTLKPLNAALSRHETILTLAQQGQRQYDELQTMHRSLANAVEVEQHVAHSHGPDEAYFNSISASVSMPQHRHDNAQSDFAARAKPLPWYKKIVQFFKTLLMGFLCIFMTTGAVTAAGQPDAKIRANSQNTRFAPVPVRDRIEGGGLEQDDDLVQPEEPMFEYDNNLGVGRRRKAGISVDGHMYDVNNDTLLLAKREIILLVQDVADSLNQSHSSSQKHKEKQLLVQKLSERITQNEDRIDHISKIRNAFSNFMALVAQNGGQGNDTTRSRDYALKQLNSRYLTLRYSLFPDKDAVTHRDLDHFLSAQASDAIRPEAPLQAQYADTVLTDYQRRFSDGVDEPVDALTDQTLSLRSARPHRISRP